MAIESREMSLAPATLPPPSLPDPQTIARPSFGDTAVREAWIEPGVIDTDGYLGFRIEAMVSAANTNGVRFGAHLRSAAGGPVLAAEPRFRDVNGQFCAVTDVAASSGVGKVSIFVPLTAISLSAGDDHFELLPALFDAENEPLSLGRPVPVVLHRDSLSIIRARVLRHSPQQIQLSIAANPHPTAIEGRIIMRLFDHLGHPIPGRAPDANASGDRIVSKDFIIGQGQLSVSNVRVAVPNLPQDRGMTAEIRLFDPLTQVWSSSAIRVPLQ
jgi:hypothetical protein